MVGTFVAVYARPLQRNVQNYSALFRKPWMKVPIYSFFFVCGFYGGIQLPYKFFPKLSPNTNTGISHSVYTSSSDIVSRFRMFEDLDQPDTREAIASYLAINSCEPVTRNEMMDHIAMNSIMRMDADKLF